MIQLALRSTRKTKELRSYCDMYFEDIKLSLDKTVTVPSVEKAQRAGNGRNVTVVLPD